MRLVLPSAAALTVLAFACGVDDAPGGPAPPAPPPADASVDAGPVPLCIDGAPSSPYPPGPHAIELTGTLPELSFTTDGPSLSLREYYEPCAPRSRLLVIRTGALWCGTCRWHAEHTRALFDGIDSLDPGRDAAARLVVIDLLAADQDNLPATIAALPAYRAEVEDPSRIARFAIDPAFTFRHVTGTRDPLPSYVFVDSRTMRVVTSAANPEPAALRGKIMEELARLDGAPPPTVVPQVERVDGFSAYEHDLIRAMGTTPGAPPPDPTNAVADRPEAAALGEALFSDVGLSPSGTVSCATCHDRTLDLADGRPQAIGAGGAKGDRNTPAIALAAHAGWLFWDGRADTLWMQALGPMEDEREMASSRLFVAHRVASAHATAYAATFPAHPLPDLADAARFPASGKPGAPAWAAMAPADQELVTQIFVDVAKALAAFERTLRVTPNALDRYAAGDTTALDAAEKAGLAVYFRTGCAQCHWGPRLTDDAFHVIRLPTGRVDGAADHGREAAAPLLLASEFTAGKKWSDAPLAARSLLGLAPPPPSMLGAFRTPTLRGLPTSGPFGHGGTVATLDEIAKLYGERGIPHDDSRAIGGTEVWVPNFDTSAQAALVPLLRALGGSVAP